MTRRSLLLLPLATPALAIRKSDIWQTDAGRRAIALRYQLEREGRYDDLPENWTEVESAIREGCQHFVPGVSRAGLRWKDLGNGWRSGRYFWRVLPVVAPPNEHGWAEPWRSIR